jgi:putative redox protein
MDAVKANIKNTQYTTTVTAAGNSITADESVENGGQARGFTPSELLASSLAACTSITLRMYANHKEWDLQEADVEVGFETADGTTRFNRNITLKGTLDEEQKQRLIDIANKCPIHKTLNNVIQITTTLA